MIKRYVLEKFNAEGETYQVVARYCSYSTALKRYNMLSYLKNKSALKGSIFYRIEELPLVHEVHEVNNVTKIDTVVKSFDYHNSALYHCNKLNLHCTDGTIRYYVDCKIKEE